MKRLKLIFPFVWYSAAIVIITCTLMCIDYSVGEASAIAVIFLPGILIARYATPQLSFADRWQGCCNTIFLWAGILAIEYFLIMLANYYILNPVTMVHHYQLPSLITNPLFILFVVAAFSITGLLIEQEIERREPYDSSVSFTSERRTIKLDPADILYIESVLTPGKGALNLTGNLGDVMKESATIGYEWVQAHHEELGITVETFEKKNLNIHVPEGAIPKDGPSAGITMVTSIVSTYTGRKVNERIAMTGETTLRGRVMPVGGIKEKILAAKRAGINTLILCEDNRKDVAEIKPEYIDGLTFHYVRSNDEVLALALEK